MTELKIIKKKTSELTAGDYDALISLKQQYWTYGKESQVQWINNNILPDDYHFGIVESGRLLAYLNVVNVDVDIDSQKYSMLGIGNVCVDNSYTSVGFGSILIACINSFIKEKQTCGILLCKEKLVGFYKLSNWRTIAADEVFVCDQHFKHNIMVYDPLKKVCWESLEFIKFSRAF